MTDLTEQWKKGKLPIGWYYIKIVDIVFIDFFEGKVWKNKKDKYVDEVIAEVPSYDGYMTLIRAYNDVVDENTKLKELLKECLAHLTIGKYGTSVTPINILCDEVEEALK